MTIIWIKPSGNEVETNELKATIEAAELAGWKRKSAQKVEKKEEKKPKKDKEE